MDEKLFLLTEMFPAADKDIIRDVLSGANNSVDEAAILLSQMNFTEAEKKKSLAPIPEKSKSNTPAQLSAPFTFAPPSPSTTSPAAIAYSFSGFSAPSVESPTKGLLASLSGNLATPIPLGPASSKPKTSSSKHGKGSASKAKKPQKSLASSEPLAQPSVLSPLPKSAESSADEWRAKAGRGPSRFQSATTRPEDDKRLKEEAERAFNTRAMIDSIPKPPISERGIPDLNPLHTTAAFCLSFGPHLRLQMESHAKENPTSSPFAFLLESHHDRVWFDYCERCTARVAQEFQSSIPYEYERLLPYKYSDHQFPLRITVLGVEFTARPPQNRSPLNDLPADIIATIATACGGNARDLMRFRLISSRWARCLRDFHGEIRIIGITKEKNKMDLRVMDLLCTLFPLARAASLDIDSYGVLTRVRLRNLRALMLRCPYAHLRDEELKLLEYTLNLQLVELDNVSDPGLHVMSMWDSLRDVRLIDCTSVSNSGVCMLVQKLPRLRSLVLLSRLFAYNHLDSTQIVSALCESTSLTSLALENVRITPRSIRDLKLKVSSLKRLTVFRPPGESIADIKVCLLEKEVAGDPSWTALLSSPCGLVASRLKHDTVAPPPPAILLIPPPPLICPIEGHGEMVRFVEKSATAFCSSCSVLLSAEETSEVAWKCSSPGCLVHICVGCWVLHRYSPRICPGAAFVAPSYITPQAASTPGVEATRTLVTGETFDEFRARESREIRKDPKNASLTLSELYSMIVNKWYSKHPPQ